jgi:hypothetical protein
MALGCFKCQLIRRSVTFSRASRFAGTFVQFSVVRSGTRPSTGFVRIVEFG